MEAKLRALYNTLCGIETKGNNTILMSDCLRFIPECIKEATEKNKEIEDLKKKIASLEKELKEKNEKTEE